LLTASGRRRLPGRLGQSAALNFGFQRGPAPVAVFAGHGQLGRRQRDPVGGCAKPGHSAGLVTCRGAKQLPCLTAKLIEVGSVGKLGHDVSSPPGLAFGRDVKTILPGSTTYYRKLWRWTQVLPANPAAPSCADAAILYNDLGL
jgi:hypothetical protein